MKEEKRQTQKTPILLTGNLAIEFKTITCMVQLYCESHHQKSLCDECQPLIEHAKQKLDRCVYGQEKPACKKCPIHCYKPQYKQQAKTIMKNTGLKMLLKHPILSYLHLKRSWKKFPEIIPLGLSNYHQRKKDL